jgi:hypothetical protein
MKDTKNTNTKASADQPMDDAHQKTILPDRVIEAARLEDERVQLEVDFDRTQQLVANAQSTLDVDLVAFDLSNEKKLHQLLLLQALVDLGTKKIELLDSLLDEKVKELQPKASSALHLVNNACAEAARGHQEIAAKAIVLHFESIKAARRASSNAPSARQWLNRRMVPAQFHDLAPMKKVLELAQQVYPEIEKLREHLGGTIPSADEMNKT